MGCNKVGQICRNMILFVRWFPVRYCGHISRGVNSSFVLSEHNMESSINELDPHRDPHRADWVQVNNTLVPCVYRGDHCHLPLNVLQFSAGILGNIDHPHLCPAVELKQTTVAERTRLDELCNAAKITFPQFPKSTLLISLADLLAVTTRRSQERGLLPKKSKKRKPGKYADLIRELDAECKSTTTRGEDPEILTARSKQKVILSQPRLSKLFLSDTCTPTLKRETSQKTDQQKQKGTSSKHTHSDRGLLRVKYIAIYYRSIHEADGG